MSPIGEHREMTDLSGFVTWESLESYIAGYTGIIKIRRLQHVAEVFESIRIPVLLLALKTIEEESLDVVTYERITQSLQANDPSFDTNTAWLKSASERADVLANKLEQQLKMYKNNLIKESIRIGHQEIANHNIKTGLLEKALKALFRTRDYCSTTDHVYEVNMSIIQVSLLVGDWQQTLTYIAKAEPSLSQMKEHEKILAENHLKAASGLALLGQSNYKRAAEQFQATAPVIGTTFNAILTMNDIANFVCLLALATFSRDEILKLSESSTFKPFLELETAARESLMAFHKSRYSECFKLIDSIKGNMRADIFFARHVDAVYGLIMERSILQFTSAFNCVKLERMANTFSIPIDAVEESLARLIAEKKLPHMRLNLRTGELVDEGNVLRNDVFDRAAQSSARYREEVERVLFHLAVTKAGLTVSAPTPQRLTDTMGISQGQAQGRAHFDQMLDDSDSMQIDGMA